MFKDELINNYYIFSCLVNVVCIEVYLDFFYIYNIIIVLKLF